MKFLKLALSLMLVLTMTVLVFGSVAVSAKPVADRILGDVNDDDSVDIDDILAVRRDMFGELALAGDDRAAALLLTPGAIDIDTILAIRSIMFGTYNPGGPTATATPQSTPMPPLEGDGPVRTPVPPSAEPTFGGVNYYVSTVGSDTNDGTSLDTAWRTLQHAVTTIRDGDTILVAGGDYVGFHVGWIYSGDPDEGDGWKCIKALDPANKPRITSAQTSVAGRPSFAQFWGTSRETGIAKARYVQYWVVDGLIVDNRANNRNDNSLNYYGFDFAIASNIVIRNCEAYGSYMTGIFCSLVDNFVAEDNLSEGNGEHGYYYNCGGSNFIFRRNISRSNAGCGFHLNGGYDLPLAQDDRPGIHYNGLYELNINSNNGLGSTTTGGVINYGTGASFNLSALRGGVVRNNLAFNEHGGGMTFYGGNASDVSRDVEIYNNTIVLAADSSRFAVNFDGNNIGHMCKDHPADAHGMGLPPHNAEDLRGEPLNLYFYNNIFGSLGTGRRLVIDTENASPGNPEGGTVPTGPRLANPNVVFKGNLFITTGGTVGFTSLPTSVSTILRASNTFNSDPAQIFVAPGATGNFRLKADSPAIGTGVYIPTAFSVADHDQNLRDAFNRDAGCYMHR